MFGLNIIHLCILDLTSFFAEPVICDSIMGAIDGPCRGHLSLSHVALMEASAVGQLNSLPSISQTWAPSPGWNLCQAVMWEWCGAEQIVENDQKAKNGHFECSLLRILYIEDLFS